MNDTTAKIMHVVDGNTSEWKAEKFEVDKETGIAYAIDHDANNIYLAMKVSDQRTQMKLMMQGMNLYIDKKGKRKEGTGIEFPIKKEGGGGFGGRGGGGRPSRGDDQNGGAQGPDLKEMRENLAATMILLKTFGLEDQEDKQQMIVVENGVNIAFEWDENNAFHVEYLVPIRFIGNQAALNGKPLGIGWKINGVELPSSAPAASVPSGGSIGRGGSGGGGGGGRGGGNSGAGRANAPSFDASDSRFKEQSIWTKYVINF
jgi:uncharacterized membrane protein YgcG